MKDPVLDENGKCIALTDWLGGTVRVGDMVLYCIGAGRGQQLAYGVVKQLVADQKMGWGNRAAEPDETPDYVTEAGGRWMRTQEPYWDYGVQVHTQGVSGWGGKRERAAWVNPMNVTALPLTLAGLIGKAGQ
ncbi:hypothetical protein ACIA8K_12840 [Catenuloplanes sp. NPDC051500]|uniref:hypothetical protein n=1 Tax=Catenuloplanes sp. NPDC051500 TaxID=3363959 RepID=UPI0037BA7951